MSARDHILEMVTAWQAETTDSKRAAHLARTLENLRFLDRVKFTPYVPSLYSSQPASFEERFHRWLNNPGISPAQQRDLFEFAYHLAFFSFDDFTAMFQNAFTGPISRWCMNGAEITLDQSEWQDRFNEERFENTWFCPVTDSLLISVFHHVNGVEGKERKPAFRDLMHFGDETEDEEKNKILKYIHDSGYKRIVLLEDFVGTGGQSIRTVEWAVRTLKLPLLFCPMIIAPEGADKYQKLKAKLDSERGKDPTFPQFTFEPILELDEDCFVETAQTATASLFGRIRSLSRDIHARLSLSQQQCKEGEFGYWKPNSPQKGATVAMFSNTPNNSLPIIHYGADQWSPLFPRVARQPL